MQNENNNIIAEDLNDIVKKEDETNNIKLYMNIVVVNAKCHVITKQSRHIVIISLR